MHACIILQALRAMPGDSDDRESAARAGADVRAAGVPERFDDRDGFERPANGQVVDQG